MLKSARIAILIVACICLNACKNNEDVADEQPTKIQKQQKLSNAAIYNTQLGIGYLKQGNVPRAKKKLLAALSQAPNSADVHAAMGYFYERTSDYDKAKTYYLKAIALAPESGSQLNNYGAFLCGRANYKEAEMYFLKAINNNQYLNTAAAYENAGLCAAAANDFAKAKRYLAKALEQDPSKRTALNELLKMEEKEGKYTESVALLEKYPELIASDKPMLQLAQNIAHKAQRADLEAFYLQRQQAKQYAQNSGVNNEYNNNIG